MVLARLAGMDDDARTAIGTDPQEQMARLQGHVFGCARCVMAGALAVAHPVARGKGSVHAAMLIVGQAPGAAGHTHGKPFSGPAGRALSAWLQTAGLPPWAHHDPDLAFVTAITRCFPGKVPGGKGDRVPSGPEIALCAPYLEAEFALVRPRVVVALGRLAATRLVGPAPLGELIGQVREIERGGQRLPVITLPHPSGVSRWLNLPANREQHLVALRRLGELLGTLPSGDEVSANAGG